MSYGKLAKENSYLDSPHFSAGNFACICKSWMHDDWTRSFATLAVDIQWICTNYSRRTITHGTSSTTIRQKCNN